MLPVFVRFARHNEGSVFLEWSKNQSGFDASAAYQPGTRTLAAYNKQKVLAFLPVQRPYVLETLAANPEATELEIASVLREFVQYLVTQSEVDQAGEIVFLGTDDGTSGLAENHIFEKLPYSVYRVRIADLEPRKEG